MFLVQIKIQPPVPYEDVFPTHSIDNRQIVWLPVSRRNLILPPILAWLTQPTRQPLCEIENLSRQNPGATGARRKSLIQTVMVRKPSSLSSVSISTSRNSSTYPPSVLSTGWEADDENSISMSTDDYVPARRLSVAIPKASAIHGPYCPRRPNLREILANTSEPPWTLAAFMAYLSNNHCLETLEFTMDAGRYKKHYAKMMSKAGTSGTPPSKDREYVQALWERLVEAYIQPSGSREVNIPSDVRDPIIRLRPGKLPPSPEALDPAVAKIYELMEDSVLVPFLNSVYPQTAHPIVASCPSNTSDESIPITGQIYEDRSPYTRRSRHSRNSPPPRTAVEPYSHSYTPPSMLERRSAPSGFNAMNKAQFNNKLSQSTSSPSIAMSSSANIDAVASGSDANASGSGGGPGMTDDSGSTDSPANESPTTPPMTPPLSDAQSPNAKRDSGMWKRLGRLSGMKAAAKKSDGGLREEQ